MTLNSFNDDGTFDDELPPDHPQAPATPPVPFAPPKVFQPEMRDELPLVQWGALAFDLAMNVSSIDEVLKVYRLTEAGLGKMLDSPVFQEALRDAKAQLKQPASQFIVRTRFAAEDLLEDMHQLGRSKNTDPALRHKIFESMARYARLDPASSKQKGEGGGGVNVTFNLAPGIQGLQHVMPAQVVIESKD